MSTAGARRSSSRAAATPVAADDQPARRCAAAAAAARRRTPPPACRRALRAAPCVLPPWPRETMPGVQPCARSQPTSAITVGVLPAPPAIRLPTTTTGTGSALGAQQRRPRSSAAAQRRRPRRRAAPAAAAAGQRAAALPGRLKAPATGQARGLLSGRGGAAPLPAPPATARTACAAKVSRISPARRAASITLIDRSGALPRRRPR